MASFSYAQKQRIADKVPPFTFLESAIDSTSISFIRTFKCISNKKDDIPSLYRAIAYQAKGLGANSFKVSSFNRDSLGVMTLVLDTYSADSSVLNSNQQMHESNVVYIFSDDKFNNKEYTVSINRVKHSLQSGKYIRHTIEQGKQVRIDKGGRIGSSLIIHWESDKPAQYVTVSGFAFTEGPPNRSGGSIGVTSGIINSLDSNLGMLLAAILIEQK